MRKREVMKKLLFVFLFVFLLSGVFAVDVGTCGVVARASCDNPATEGYVVMGLSSSTNSHGESTITGAYPYVLCCNIGNGVGANECTATNTIIKLSSSTNAHAEEPSLSHYLTRVCYEDFVCRKTTTTCDADEKGILSLTADTNAHIGKFDDYDTKICCGGPSIESLSCRINSANWNMNEAIEGQRVYLNVQGSGAECDGNSLSFEVDGGSEAVQEQPSAVGFIDADGTGLWIAEHQTGGLFGLGDADYYFTASLTDNPLVSEVSDAPELIVREREEDYCAAITSCSDYEDSLDCESDATVCNVATSGGSGIVDCSDPTVFCGCSWDDETSACSFGYSEVEEELCGSPVEGEGCEYGCTLCHNAGGNYCNAGASCPAGESPSSNNNGSCDFGEGCLSSDCQDGDRDTCAEGTYCLSGACGNVAGPVLSLGLCKISQETTKECGEEGYKTVTLTTEWGGEQSGARYEKCIARNGQTVQISCPALIQLPFFDYVEIIIAVLAIAFIYISIMLKQKFFRIKKNKK